MTKFSAPYRFIPFNEKVYIPDWLNDDRPPIDWPYKEGISGTISLKIKTITPLFIGAEKVEGDNKKETFKINGKAAIPGTSLKGMTRSVLEAITFGSLKDRIDNKSLSIRDLHNKPDYLEHLVGMENGKPKSRAGWLRFDGEHWKLQECDYSVVQQKDLEDYYQRKFKKTIYLGGGKTLAGQKYKEWGFDRREISFAAGAWQRNICDSFAKERELSRASNLGSGKTNGTLVLTGQPQDRKSNKNAKFLEFIFHTTIDEEKIVPEKVRADFESIHRDANTNKPNDDWKFWLDKAKANRKNKDFKIPVFWVVGTTEKADEFPVRAMGLAMMFRLAYKNSIHDAAKQTVNDSGKLFGEELDFADVIFGCVRKDDKKSLKGRANFTHALMSKGEMGKETTETLLSPKPSFYPSYVRQETHIKDGQLYKKGNHGYTTLMSPNARIRGYKRYPVSNKIRKSTISNVGSRNSINEDVHTTFTPVAMGAEFNCQLRIFNLLPQELGALIWVLTWGGKEGHAHALGGAKPLGYGAVEISIDYDKSSLAKNDDAEYEQLNGDKAKAILDNSVDQFTDCMNIVTKKITGNNNWEECEQVREALASANLERGDGLANSGYLNNMQLQGFNNVKKAGLILPLASGEIDKESTKVNPTPQTSSAGGGRSFGAQRGGIHSKKNISYDNEPLYKKGEKVITVEEPDFEATVVKDQLSANDKVEIDWGGGDIETVDATVLKRK